jgi:uncharacterized membrane-anchored protein
MAIRLRRRASSSPNGSRDGDEPGVIAGKARLDRRTKRLTPRLHPGDIAIIDHAELDRVAAETLVERGVAAVVNARGSVSTRYPNLGPLVLARAHVPILDAVGEAVFTRVREGDHVRIVGNRLYVNGDAVAEGTALTEETIRTRMDAAHSRLSETVEDFAENTLQYVRREQDILLDTVKTPDLKTRFRGRHALVVTRGYHYKEDLDALRVYIGEMRPVVIAVDGAADACLERGIRPDIILGDMDSVSTEALGSGAELLVHAYPEGGAPGLETVQALALDAQVICVPGTSEDVALLLAYERGAELIVAVGLHNSVVEFLDKGRQGMASTFLARLRVGPRLVDAKGVSQLYRRADVRTRDLLLLVAAALLVMIIVSATLEPFRVYWSAVWESVRNSWFHLRSLL